MADYDKEQWQAEEQARDEAQTAFRDKMAKSRQRSANNAKRKISRLHAKLKELGHISEFEDEFGESVLDRLEKYGSAFHDPEKGRAGDALSLAQRQVVNRMNKKVKELKAKQKAKEADGSSDDFEEDYVRTGWGSAKTKTSKSGHSGKSDFQQKNGFKRKSQFTPRIRQLDEDLADEPVNAVGDKALDREGRCSPEISGSSLPVFDDIVRPFLPQYRPETNRKAQRQSREEAPSVPAKTTQAKKPFLRVISSD